VKLTLSLNSPPSNQLFIEQQTESHFEADKVPAPRSENAYPEPLTKYIVSMLRDKSYFVEWPFLEIVFKEYGFWSGLSRVHLHFGDIHSLSVLHFHLYLGRGQTILDVIADADDGDDGDGADNGGDGDGDGVRYHRYFKLLMTLNDTLSDHEDGDGDGDRFRVKERTKNGLTLPLIVQHMMTNIGAKQTAQCLSHPLIAPLLKRCTESTTIYRQIVHQQQREQRRETLTRSLLRSLDHELRSQYTLNSITSTLRPKGTEREPLDEQQSAQSKEYRDLVQTLSGIKHWSDEWAVMRSVNAQPPKQRMAASLERNLSDLLMQFV